MNLKPAFLIFTLSALLLNLQEALARPPEARYAGEVSCLHELRAAGLPFVKDKSSKSADAIIQESVRNDLLNTFKNWNAIMGPTEAALTQNQDSIDPISRKVIEKLVGVHQEYIKGNLQPFDQLVNEEIHSDESIVSEASDTRKKIYYLASDGQTYRFQVESETAGVEYRIQFELNGKKEELPLGYIDDGVVFGWVSENAKILTQKPELHFSKDTDEFVRQSVERFVKRAVTAAIGTSAAETLPGQNMLVLNNEEDPNAPRYDRASLQTALTRCKSKITDVKSLRTLNQAASLLLVPASAPTTQTQKPSLSHSVL